MQSNAPVIIPSHYNYIGLFLTLGCNLSCSYCINYLSGLEKKRKQLNASEWIRCINRLQLPNGLPITIQGGEPSIHTGFFQILAGIRNDINIDLLTNLQFDVDKLRDFVPAKRFIRDSPYASIRVSYHPETMEIAPLLKKASSLIKSGYPVAIYSVNIDKYKDQLSRAQQLAHDLHIPFKLKDLLGKFDGILHGEMRYKDAVGATSLQDCECKTSELLISPEGEIFRCHHDLYNKKLSTGSLLNPNFSITDSYMPCQFYGNCNPCDIKVKNNRFQKYGHTSVTIKNIRLKN